MVTGQTYRVQIDLFDQTVHGIDDVSATEAEDCVRRFFHRVADGLVFITTSGVLSWTWAEIRGVGVIRMDTLTDLERQPRLHWTLTAGERAS